MRNFGQIAFRALRRSGRPDSEPRKPAERIWAHATSDTRLAALLDIQIRLSHLRPDLQFVFSIDPKRVNPEAVEGCNAVDLVRLVDDLPASGRRFLDRWAPDICIWTGGHLLTATLAQAARRNVSLVLVDADETGFKGVRRGVFSSPITSTLDAFAAIFATSRAAASLLERLGASPERLSITVPLHQSSHPCKVNAEDLTEISDMLVGRQVWLAAHVCADEAEAIVNAQLQAAGLSHRLLAIIVPDSAEDAAAFRDRLAVSGLRWSVWDPDVAPDDSVQAVLCSGETDIGVWYRIAALSFIGCSLGACLGGRSPLAAAALGSAVIHGPNIRAHAPIYDRLAKAGAAYVVRDASALLRGVLRFSAPDQSAAMALAAWDVATESATVTDQIVDLLQDLLDTREANDARA